MKNAPAPSEALSDDVLKALFAFLEGAWQFNRHISEPKAHMTGSARFTPHTTVRFHYSENGELHLSATNQKFESYRDYIYELEPDAITTYFADGPDNGKMFQRLRPLSPSHETLGGVHPCKLDSYRSTYKFLDENRFSLVHHVTGPTKNYTSTTTYTRILH